QPRTGDGGAAAPVRLRSEAHPAVVAGPAAVPHADAATAVRCAGVRRADAPGAVGRLRSRVGRADPPGGRRPEHAPPSGGAGARGGAGVNVLGHTYVARAVGNASPEHVLGAVLPDLAPMAGVRVRRNELDGDLAEGVRCHLRTDAAFHAHRDFRAGSRALREA